MTGPSSETPRVRARLHHLVADCADPQTCARFWSALLDQPVTYDDGDFVVVAASDRHSGLAFRRAPEHRRPTGPDPAVPQQLHLDVMVEDPGAAASRVLSLGATGLGADVYADPGGHPFCLVRRPGWASPLDGWDLSADDEAQTAAGGSGGTSTDTSAG